MIRHSVMAGLVPSIPIDAPELFPLAWDHLSSLACRIFNGEPDPLRRKMLSRLWDRHHRRGPVMLGPWSRLPQASLRRPRASSIFALRVSASSRR
jgi:hypothetical protein